MGTQEHSRTLFNSMSNVRWADKMLLKDESFPGQGFILQPDLRNHLEPQNRDFYILSRYAVLLPRN